MPAPNVPTRSAITVVRAMLPILAVCLLLWLLTTDRAPHPIAIFLVFAACGIILWFGWNWVRPYAAAKWIALFLAIYLGFVLALFLFGILFGIAARVSSVLLPLFLLALPFLLYDLLFRSPFRGRFSRARAERMRVRS
jgi:hypothetical protein